MEFSTSITDILKLHRSILTDLQKRLGSSQGSITLTTSGTSGASTLIGNSLNIPLYSSGATTSWGSITGTLASQTDLNSALLAKVTGNSSITGATKTKITYDSKGLVTSGADATTADIADSLNKRYVTDAQQTIIGNTSGTNTGDNATNSQYSGLAASKQDTLVSGTNIKTINSTTLLGSGNITTGSVTSVGGTGTVSGLSLSGSVTTTGNLTLGGTLSLTSGDVTTALGFTPYNATNPSGYTNNTGTVTSVSGTGTISGLTLTGTVTNSGSLTLGGTLSLSSLNVTTALGYTPYNATNPSGYTTNVGTVTSIATGTGLTGGTITGSGTISFSTAAVGTWAATPSSANLASAMTDETGSGSLVFGTSPTFTNSITVNGSTISGYNTTPLEGAIKDGVTSILGDLSTWTTGCYQGTVLYSETSSTTIAFGQLCYRTNAGQWGLADATSFAASAYYMLGICLKTTTGPSQPTSILINGFVESTYVADFKVGEPQYMATTAGSMTKSAPASSGNIVRIIGNTFWTTALQTNAKCVLHFNPDKTWIELT